MNPISMAMFLVCYAYYYLQCLDRYEWSKPNTNIKLYVVVEGERDDISTGEVDL